MSEFFVDFCYVYLVYDGVVEFVVEDIDLQICVGEFIVIVGLFGCGKFIFMKLVIGLKQFNCGSVVINGQMVMGLFKFVGMVFQVLILLFWCIMLENVLLLLEIVEFYWCEFKQKKVEYIECVFKLFKIVGLDGYVDKFLW